MKNRIRVMMQEDSLYSTGYDERKKWTGCLEAAVRVLDWKLDRVHLNRSRKGINKHVLVRARLGKSLGDAKLGFFCLFVLSWKHLLV